MVIISIKKTYNEILYLMSAIRSVLKVFIFNLNKGETKSLSQVTFLEIKVAEANITFQSMSKLK